MSTDEVSIWCRTCRTHSIARSIFLLNQRSYDIYLIMSVASESSGALLSDLLCSRPPHSWFWVSIGHTNLYLCRVSHSYQNHLSVNAFSRNIVKVVSILIEANIPHNLVMLRGAPFNQGSLLIPRKPVYG